MFQVINLDDENEVSDFIHTYKTDKGRRLANRLKIAGKGSAQKATDLSSYAWNKTTAISCRKKGDIETALKYERICDSIYGSMDKSIKW